MWHFFDMGRKSDGKGLVERRRKEKENEEIAKSHTAVAPWLRGRTLQCDMMRSKDRKGRRQFL